MTKVIVNLYDIVFFILLLYNYSTVIFLDMEGLNSKNFVAMSKLIEQNRIAPNLVEESMKS
jgi:hypothetical protein